MCLACTQVQRRISPTVANLLYNFAPCRKPLKRAPCFACCGASASHRPSGTARGMSCLQWHPDPVFRPTHRWCAARLTCLQAWQLRHGSVTRGSWLYSLQCGDAAWRCIAACHANQRSIRDHSLRCHDPGLRSLQCVGQAHLLAICCLGDVGCATAAPELLGQSRLHFES